VGRGLSTLTLILIPLLGCGPAFGSSSTATDSDTATESSSGPTLTSTGPSTATNTTTGPQCESDFDCGDFDYCEDGKCVECIGCCALVENQHRPRCSPPFETDSDTFTSGTSVTSSSGSDTGTSTGTSTGGLQAPQQLCEGTGGTWDRFSCGHYDCGVPSADACVDPGCDCGLVKNFVDGVGCQQDAACV
jgi:hypothetical protein